MTRSNGHNPASARIKNERSRKRWNGASAILGNEDANKLREPPKPRREHGAADEDHGNVNNQRPEWSHGMKICFSNYRAKR